MKNVLKLFAYEFKNIYKQALIFAFISTFLFALSISVMCFSTDMVQGYRDYLDEDGWYYSVDIYNVTDFESYKELNKLGDDFYARAYGMTQACAEATDDGYRYSPMLQKGDVASGYWGVAYLFREELPYEISYDCYISEGEYGGTASNERNADGRYPIYLTIETAKELEAGVGDILTYSYYLTDGLHTDEEMYVAGIFQYKEGVNIANYLYDFIIPFSLIYENKDMLTSNNSDHIVSACNFYLQLRTASDIMEVLPKIRRLDAGKMGNYDEINLVNTMRYILIAVSVAIIAVTFVVLSNSLTITVNSRKKFMAKLKLLGATTDKITAAYFILLIASFVVAFALSVLLSYLLCGYFTSIAVVAFEYKVTMKLHWGAVGILFGVGCVLLAVRYLLFRLKVKKVSPAEFIKEY